MTEPAALTHGRALIQCESVTPVEGGALDYLEKILRRAGFVRHRMPFSEPGAADVDNLYARFGTKAPHLCYAGHTDVVPVGDPEAWDHPPFAAEIHDGLLHGRGAADMKGGIACFLAAVEAHLRAAPDLPGSISFLITGDEEGPAINGTVKMLKRLEEMGEKIDHCIVGEPSNTALIGDTIKIGRRGSLNGVITVHGKQGHVAYQHLADNPVPGLVRVLERLKSKPLDLGTDHFIASNLEVTNLHVGNEATNIIPAKASARFNIRFNDAQTPQGLQDRLHADAKAALEGTALTYDIAFQLSGESFVTDPGGFVQDLQDAIREETGLETELSTSGGTSDARFIKNYCPVIEFGLVNATIHQVNEHTPLQHLDQLTAIYGNFLRRYFR